MHRFLTPMLTPCASRSPSASHLFFEALVTTGLRRREKVLPPDTLQSWPPCSPSRFDPWRCLRDPYAH